MINFPLWLSIKKYYTIILLGKEDDLQSLKNVDHLLAVIKHEFGYILSENEVIQVKQTLCTNCFY